MRKLLPLVLLSAVAFAGTRWSQTNGSVPTSPTAGVPLIGMKGCRGTVRFTDGGTVSGGKLIPMYYDSAIAQWVEGKTADQCALSTDVLADGGARRAQLCEFEVLSQYGRASLVASALTPQTQGIVRLECWGPDVPQQDGGAQ